MNFLRSRFLDYCVISLVTGALDYALALWLLHYYHFPLYFALAASMIIAGVLEYIWLQKGGFADDKRFSARRLAASSATEALAYGLRLAAMTEWHRHLDNHFWENALGMMLAYSLSFLVGYFLRRYVVFINVIEKFPKTAPALPPAAPQEND